MSVDQRMLAEGVDEKMTALADAIRDKANTSGKMTIDEMTVTVRGISVGDGDATVQTNKSATITSASGTISPDSGYDSMSSVKYDLDSASKANLKAENIKPGVKILGVTGNYEPPTESIIITSAKNKTYVPSEGKVGFEVVDVAINKESIDITPTKNTQVFDYSDGDVVCTRVLVDPIPPEYIVPEGGDVITENGKNIDVRELAYIDVAVPDTECNHQEVLTITDFTKKQYTPPADYNAFATVELEIQTETATVTPKKEHQEIEPDSGNVLTKVTVNPIPDAYIIPTGTKTLTENGTHDIKSYESVRVNVSAAAGGNSLIAGKWLFYNAMTTPPEVNFAVNFTDGEGNAYRRINTIVQDTSWSMYYVSNSGGIQMAASDGSVEDPWYADIDFGDTPQVIPSVFASWMMANATYMGGGGSAVETVAVTIEDGPNLYNRVKVTYTGVDGAGNPYVTSARVLHTDWNSGEPIYAVVGTPLVIESEDEGYVVGYDSYSGITSVYNAKGVLICYVGREACSITPNQSKDSGGSAIETYDLCIFSSSGDEYPMSIQHCFPYVENGEVKWTYGYECLHLPGGVGTFKVPKNSLVLLNPGGDYDASTTGFEKEYMFSSMDYQHYYKLTGNAEVYIPN